MCLFDYWLTLVMNAWGGDVPVDYYRAQGQTTVVCICTCTALSRALAVSGPPHTFGLALQMKRSDTPRDEYEKLSRDIRYSLYKTSMAEVANDVPAVLVCCMPMLYYVACATVYMFTVMFSRCRYMHLFMGALC